MNMDEELPAATGLAQRAPRRLFWNRMSQAQPEHDPIFEDFLQLLAAIFESLARGPNAWARGDFAVVRFGVLNDFVMGVPHGSLDVRREHVFILARRGD
jgi:hypothetical protein